MPIRGKTNKQIKTQHKSHPIQAYTNHWTNFKRAETKKKKEFNLETWEREDEGNFTWLLFLQFSSVQFSRSFVSDSLRTHESQHARLPCPSPTPGVYPNSRASSRWCHPGISSSVVPFSSCAQSLPASRSFPMSQIFARGGQSIGVSALTSVLPMNT